MSQEMIERFLGRLLTDDNYRQLAQRSVPDACREAGYNLSAEELMAITRGDLVRIELIAERLDSTIRRFQLRRPEWITKTTQDCASTQKTIKQGR